MHWLSVNLVGKGVPEAPVTVHAVGWIFCVCFKLFKLIKRWNTRSEINELPLFFRRCMCRSDQNEPWVEALSPFFSFSFSFVKKVLNFHVLFSQRPYIHYWRNQWLHPPQQNHQERSAPARAFLEHLMKGWGSLIQQTCSSPPTCLEITACHAHNYWVCLQHLGCHKKK